MVASAIVGQFTENVGHNAEVRDGGGWEDWEGKHKSHRKEYSPPLHHGLLQ